MRIFLSFVFVLLFSTSALAVPSSYFNGLQVGKNSAVVVFDVESGKTLYSAGGMRTLKPASVLKLLTAATALEHYGPYHRFKTEVYATGLKGTHVEKLYVKGFGDPNFTQEDLWLIARKIYLRGVRSVGQVVVDDSYFVDPRGRQGPRAYEAGGSALSLNFNSITFEVCPIGGMSKALVTHDPREMPVKIDGAISTASKGGTFNIDQLKGQENSVPLHFKISGRISKRSGCQEIYRSIEDPAVYFGFVLKGMLEREGTQVRKGVARGKTPKGLAVLHTARSEYLHDIISDLNTFSNNMIAEQLLMHLGKARDGYCYRDKGLARLGDYLQKLGVGQEEYVLHDGSGLSHKNRMTAHSIALLLRETLVRPQSNIEFLASLPVDGKSGTLRKRTLAGTTRAKTGTLNGVMSLAGVVDNETGKTYGFVILQNHLSDRAKGSRLEKKVVSLLRELPR